MKVADMVDAYLTRQMSLGMRFESAAKILRHFSRTIGNPKIDEVTPEAVAEFLYGKGPLSATWMLRYKVLKGFYKWLFGDFGGSKRAFDGLRSAEKLGYARFSRD